MRTTIKESLFATNFGPATAQHTLEIFYGAECPFSKEFLQNDLNLLIKKYIVNDNQSKLKIKCYPSALDVQTINHTSLMKQISNMKRRTKLRQGTRIIAEDSVKGIDVDFWDGIYTIAAILDFHQDVTETPLIKINGTLYPFVPTVDAIEETLIRSAIKLVG